MSEPAQVARNYHACTRIAGSLVPAVPGPTTVAFREVLTRRQHLILRGMVLLAALTSVAFFAWLILPWHIPDSGDRFGTWGMVLGIAGFGAIVGIELLRLAQSAVLCLYATRMRDPIPLRPEPGLRVAILTTIVPSKEPVDLVARTLRAMRRIEYDGHVDVWILDEGDDPEVRRVARELGVRHFTRNGRPEFNQPSGPYRARSKAGNHNAWRAEHEHEYDIVAQMDPDHVPVPEFLERTLGFFRDPDVAFVVAPQVYGNPHESFVARGAADQSSLFHGVIQRGGNSLEAPLLIGTNHLYRTSALSQIGGYQDSIIEDHLTSLTLNITANPRTGHRWKGIYTPDILAIGEGPAHWTDYFNQQQRWAYGVWEIVLKHSPRLLPRLNWSQRLAYISLQAFYPSVGLIFVLGNLLTASYLLLGVQALTVEAGWWLAFWLPSVLSQLVLFLWLRRFNLAEHERALRPALTGLLLSLAAGPIYVTAGVNALLRRPLVYVVTAKSTLASRDSLVTFRLHGGWALAALAALTLGSVLGHQHTPLRAWAWFTVAVALFPVVLFTIAALRHARVAGMVQGLRPQRPSAAFAGVPLLLVLALLTELAAPAWSRLPRQMPDEIDVLNAQGHVVTDASAAEASVDTGLVESPGRSGSSTRPGTSAPAQAFQPGKAGGARFTTGTASAPVEPDRSWLGLPGDDPERVMYGVFDHDPLSDAGELNHVFYQWNEPAGSFAGFATFSINQGQIPLISWEPRHGPITRLPSSPDLALLGEIAAGQHDDYIRDVALALRNNQYPVIIRFGFEMDLDPTGLHPWAGQDPQTYVAAYRRVVDLTRGQGAHNVRWVWSPSAMTDASGQLVAMPYFPGVEYVDYTGFSAFIFWQWEESTPERAAVHAFRSPSEYFSGPIAQLAALGAPVIVAELGVDLHDSRQSERGTWLETFAAEAAAGHYPGLVAVIYFNLEHNWHEDADWSLAPDELRRWEAPLRQRETSTGSHQEPADALRP